MVPWEFPFITCHGSFRSLLVMGVSVSVMGVSTDQRKVESLAGFPLPQRKIHNKKQKQGSNMVNEQTTKEEKGRKEGRKERKKERKKERRKKKI